jgi:hypothetical protein
VLAQNGRIGAAQLVGNLRQQRTGEPVLRHRAEIVARIHVAPDRRAPAEAPQLVERFIGQEIVDNHELGPALAPPRRDLAAGRIVTDRSPRYPLPRIEVNLPSPRANISDLLPPAAMGWGTGI